MLQELSNETSWGADGAAAELLLQVAEVIWAGMIGGAAWDFSKSLAVKLGGGRIPTAQLLTDQEAEARSRWRVEVKYGVAPDDLSLRSIEVQDGGERAVVVLVDPATNVVYEVEHAIASNAVRMTRLKRTLP